MSNSSVNILLKEIDNLSREEKIQLLYYLTKKLEMQNLKTESKNLVKLFQNSPLFGLDIDLERQRDLDRSNLYYK